MTESEIDDRLKSENLDHVHEKLRGPDSCNMAEGNSSHNSYQKPLLILINPHSGRGKSLKIFKNQVQRIFNSHHVAHEVFVTTPDCRVKEYLNSKNLAQLTSYKSITVVSGDGLLYETVNAIMTRDDWQQAISMPIGVIPTGSGNGLAYTLLNLSKVNVKRHSEAVNVCCEQAMQNDTCSSDLVKIVYGKNNTVWSFLSIGWGLLADIDIDSEWLRCLGEFRFTLYGVMKAVSSVSRKGRLSYKLAPVDSDQTHELKTKLIGEANSDKSMYDGTHASSDNLDDDADWIHIEDKFACVYAVHQPYVNSATNFSPKSSLADQLTYLTYVRGKLNPFRVIEFLLAIEDGSHEKLPYVRVIPVQYFKFQPLEPSKVVVDGEVIPWSVKEGPLWAEVVPKVLRLSWSLFE